VTDITSPSVRQRELGTQLRELRNQHGLTVEDVAEHLEWSTTKISRIETGARCPGLSDVRDLWACYSVNRSARARLIARAWEAWKRGWWTDYDDFKLDPFSGSGDPAVSGSFMMYYVPVLLQTEEYARKIIDDIEPKMTVGVSRQWAQARICYEEVYAPGSWRRYRIARE